MNRMRTSFDPNSHAWIAFGLVGFLILAGIVFVLLSGDDRGDAPPPFEITPTVPGEVTGTPTVTAVATPPEVTPPAPEATPHPTALVLAEDECLEGCLVRIPATDETEALLAETRERPSFRSENWLWTIISRETADRLAADDVSIELVQDSRETVYLYATRLPEDAPGMEPVEAFGEVLDSVDGHAIVEVESVPAVVTGLVNEGVWIEKLLPAAPVNIADIASAGQGPSISEVELGVLLPEVSASNITEIITELQASSSTDGSGIGTRHYSTTGNVMAGEYLFTTLESYGLRVWYEDFITPEGYLSTNVIAEIPGRDDSAIYGVLAHFDSIGTDISEAPGADDNGTGVAGALEIARILAAYELEHPVHIIFVNAEETAILGSMAYAAKVVEDGTPIEGVYNLDTIGTTGYGTRIIVNSGPQSAWMTDLMIRMNEGYGLGQDIWARQNPAIVADDNMLRDRGIEAVLVARLMAGDYTVHHTGADILDVLSMDNTITATQLVLLCIAAVVQ